GPIDQLLLANGRPEGPVGHRGGRPRVEGDGMQLTIDGVQLPERGVDPIDKRLGKNRVQRLQKPFLGIHRGAPQVVPEDVGRGAGRDGGRDPHREVSPRNDLHLDLHIGVHLHELLGLAHLQVAGALGSGVALHVGKPGSHPVGDGHLLLSLGDAYTQAQDGYQHSQGGTHRPDPLHLRSSPQPSSFSILGQLCLCPLGAPSALTDRKSTVLPRPANWAGQPPSLGRETHRTPNAWSRSRSARSWAGSNSSKGPGTRPTEYPRWRKMALKQAYALG